MRKINTNPRKLYRVYFDKMLFRYLQKQLSFKIIIFNYSALHHF